MTLQGLLSVPVRRRKCLRMPFRRRCRETEENGRSKGRAKRDTGKIAAPKDKYGARLGYVTAGCIRATPSTRLPALPLRPFYTPLPLRLCPLDVL